MKRRPLTADGPPKRLAFGNVDRLVFTALYRVAPGILDALKILKPQTVIRWHRAGFRVQFEGFWSIFKRGVVGTFNKVSKKYMPLYVAEFQFRYNNRE
jgi:hypothetical protein